MAIETVGELIAELQKCDPESEPFVGIARNGTFTEMMCVVQVHSVACTQTVIIFGETTHKLQSQ